MAAPSFDIATPAGLVDLQRWALGELLAGRIEPDVAAAIAALSGNLIRDRGHARGAEFAVAAAAASARVGRPG